jgi:hypothetical protein
MAYVEQITFLLFLKMADEQTKPPYNRKPIVPAGFDWASLLAKEGDALEARYRHILEKLSTQPGMLGEVFKKAKREIQNPVTLRRLIVDLIEPEKWMSMQADVKGDIYEGLLAKSAAESPKGAGQYFTPRELIKAIVDCARPTAADTLCDPACGTGGFLLGAYDYQPARARPAGAGDCQGFKGGDGAVRGHCQRVEGVSRSGPKSSAAGGSPDAAAPPRTGRCSLRARPIVTSVHFSVTLSGESGKCMSTWR